MLGVGTALDLFIDMLLPPVIERPGPQQVGYRVEFFIGRHWLFPGHGEIAPGIGSLTCKVVLRSTLVGAQVLIPLGLIASQTLDTLSAARSIEAGKPDRCPESTGGHKRRLLQRDRDASGVDAVHQ